MGTAVDESEEPGAGKVGLRLGGLAVETVGLKVTCRFAFGDGVVGLGEEGWRRRGVVSDGPELAILLIVSALCHV